MSDVKRPNQCTAPLCGRVNDDPKSRHAHEWLRENGVKEDDPLLSYCATHVRDSLIRRREQMRKEEAKKADEALKAIRAETKQRREANKKRQEDATAALDNLPTILDERKTAMKQRRKPKKNDPKNLLALESVGSLLGISEKQVNQLVFFDVIPVVRQDVMDGSPLTTKVAIRSLIGSVLVSTPSFERLPLGLQEVLKQNRTKLLGLLGYGGALD